MALLRIRGNTIVRGVRISRSSQCSAVDLGSRVIVNPAVVLADVRVGRFTYFQRGAVATVATIGAFCSIAEYARIGATNHPVHRFTTHPITFDFQVGVIPPEHPLATEVWRNIRETPTIVGNDVWIGHGAIVMAGVTVGDGAVIGAGAVVTKPVPPYAIMAGVPARVLRYRFDQQVATALQDSDWWNWHTTVLSTFADSMTKAASFIRQFHEQRIQPDEPKLHTVEQESSIPR